MFLRSLTTEAMGIWRFAGAFAVVERQSECGSKTAGMHVSQPMNIGVCYGLVVLSFYFFFRTLITQICRKNRQSPVTKEKSFSLLSDDSKICCKLTHLF